jgi:glutamyl-tRNA synthetase
MFALDLHEKLMLADARNFLFNYLFAHHHHGHLYLRADDTRESAPGAQADPLEALRWLGLDWESSPQHPGEKGRPFRVSERLELYRGYAKKLIDQGLAYYCFCSRETLQTMFTQQKIHGQTPHYDGRCLRLAAPDREALKHSGRPFQIRLKTPEVVMEVHDIVRGRLIFDPQQVADLVIQRYEGLPSVALANVVDQHVEEVTHVMRGDRHKAETPREAFLCQAFGFKPPEYIHIPLLLGEDRSLLSERHGDKYVEDYRAKGYLPEAMLNYLTYHGFNPGPDDQLRSIGTLVRNFKVEEIFLDPTVWHIDKLQALNRLALDKLKDDALAHALAPYVAQAGYDLFARGEAWAREFVASIRPGLKCLADVKDSIEVFFADKYTPDKKGQALLKDPDAKKIVEALEAALERFPEVTHENYREVIDAARSQLAGKGKALILVRVALTGQEIGPEFSKLLPLLGRQRMLARLENARRYIPRGMKREA